jgi:hypothetical protein
MVLAPFHALDGVLSAQYCDFAMLARARAPTMRKLSTRKE